MTEGEEEARRSRANRAVLIAVAAIVILGVLLMRWLASTRTTYGFPDCSGRFCIATVQLVEQPQDQ